jgi:cytochrome oxidase Cu insertion factor (SCO1/SenC/PrrC family)
LSGRSADARIRRDAGLALAALASIGLITLGWWALALWPAPATPPPWLVTARSACFGAAPDGLPDTAGWMVLIGQPLGMVALLAAVAGRAIGEGLRGLRASGAGRTVLAFVLVVVAAGAAAAALRVRTVAAAIPSGDAAPAGRVERLNEPAPDLALLDHRGRRVSLDRYRGRPILVAFAYGHCETVCPLSVREVRRARELAAELEPVVVVVTVDPWRDTPARLSHIALSWGLRDDEHLLGGSVAEVEAVLDAWRVPRARNARTGEVVHVPVVYVVDRAGSLAWASSAAAPPLARLLRSLPAGP